MRRYLLSFPILLAMSGAAFALDGSVDGTSKESYERSIKAMADQLSPEDKEVFSKGLINLIVTKYPPAAGAQGFALLQFMPQAIESAHINMAGVTADEIMARGRELVAASKPTSQAAAGSVVADLTACLRQKVTISSPSFEKGDYGYSSEFKVTNNLPYAIAGVWIDYTIKSDNRSVPWEENNFVQSISGGIEPGETRTLSTSFSLLSRETPPTAKVSMSVRDVADPEKKLVIKPGGGVIGWPEEKSDKGCKL
ncbi:hypothetical protein [Shinella sp.]|uniref:hypothetical protein n=1 Tax=Shinella sp. TaxID=1870904 RepID=UPI0039E36892